MSEVLSGYGLRARLPEFWEGRVFLRQDPRTPGAAPRAGALEALGGQAAQATERVTPVLHLGNFALPGRRGDFGTGAVELMGQRHAFVALLEYGPDEVGTALFAEQQLPRPRPQDFTPNQLQQKLAGQLGYQRFFTHADRAWCLFVVLGSRSDVPGLCAQVNTALDGIEVS
ncbi:hypothetical protein [Thalassiella azotivora]